MPGRRISSSWVQIINCVYADPAVAMARICAKSGAELIIPHRLSGSVPTISGSVPNVLDGVLGQIGIEKVYLDPMIGFGTSREEDIELLGSVPELAKLGKVLVGASRKRIVKKLTGEKMTGKNLGGNLRMALQFCLLCLINPRSCRKINHKTLFRQRKNKLYWIRIQ